LGIGDWAQSPIPNPQSPIPNPHFLFDNKNKNICFIINNIKINIKLIKKYIKNKNENSWT